MEIDIALGVGPGGGDHRDVQSRQPEAQLVAFMADEILTRIGHRRAPAAVRIEHRADAGLAQHRLGAADLGFEREAHLALRHDVQFQLACFRQRQQRLGGFHVAGDKTRDQALETEFLDGAGRAPAPALAADGDPGQPAGSALRHEVFADGPEQRRAAGIARHAGGQAARAVGHQARRIAGRHETRIELPRRLVVQISLRPREAPAHNARCQYYFVQGSHRMRQ